MSAMGAANSTPSSTLLVEEQPHKIAIVREEAGKLFFVLDKVSEGKSHRAWEHADVVPPHRKNHPAEPRNSASKAVRKIWKESSVKSMKSECIVDDQSDHTRSTSGSPSFPSKPRTSSGTKSSVHLKPRSGAIVANMKSGLGMRSPSKNQSSASRKFPKHQRTDADPASDGTEGCGGPFLSRPPRSSKIPVRNASHHHHNNNHIDVHEEDTEHLKRIYDMRTWDMYLRITEARKNATVAQTPSTAIPAVVPSCYVLVPATQGNNNDSYSHYIEHDDESDHPFDDKNTSTYSSEHEMVFDLDED
jgi:hypothetical protein